MQVPEWLLTKENYLPDSDNDGFVNKSLSSLFRLISAIRMQETESAGKFRVGTFYKLIFTLALIVFVSIARQFAFVFIVLTYLLLRLTIMPVKPMKRVLAVSLAAAVFSFVIMVPAALYNNTYSLTMIPAKIFVSVTAVGLLSASSRWNDIIAALRLIRIPNIFIFILDTAIKYIYMLGEFTLEMLSALKLRSVGKNKNKYTSLSGIAGTLFLHSKEMSEEMQYAMECRGFTGEYKSGKRVGFTPADGGYILLNAIIITGFFLFGR